MFLRHALVSALLLLAPATAFAAAEVGKTAPDFTASDIEGKSVSPAALKGKIVVLEWNNPHCPFVRKHYDGGNMQKLQSYAKGKDVVWVTVNSSADGKQGNMTAEKAKEYVKDSKLSSAHYILDPEGKIGKLYGAKATPHMFVIDAKGNIAYMGAIDSDSAIDQSAITGATNYAKEAIDSLLAGKPVATASSQAYGCPVKY